MGRAGTRCRGCAQQEHGHHQSTSTSGHAGQRSLSRRGRATPIVTSSSAATASGSWWKIAPRYLDFARLGGHASGPAHLMLVARSPVRFERPGGGFVARAGRMEIPRASAVLFERMPSQKKVAPVAGCRERGGCDSDSMTVQPAPDIVVIGAGVIGLSTAVSLAERGGRVELRAQRGPTHTTSPVASAMIGRGRRRGTPGARLDRRIHRSGRGGRLRGDDPARAAGQPRAATCSGGHPALSLTWCPPALSPRPGPPSRLSTCRSTSTTSPDG